jgi:predicted nucleic acid-binding protein
LIAPDTSVLVAAFGRWHESHAAARAALADSPVVLLAPVAAESFSVLTRLPPPYRTPPRLVLAFLDAHFGDAPVALSGSGVRALLTEVEAAAIIGGGVYYALVASTSREAGATLVSLDQRAARVYRALGVEHALLA